MMLTLIAAALFAAAAPGPVCDAQWVDPARGGRIVPVRIRMPAGTGKVPVILFSHGLGGSLDAGTLWAQAWVADGDAVIHLQHAGSDSRIIGSGTLKSAMNVVQSQARVADVGFVLDQIAVRSREGACDLTRLDLKRIGMSGHSFGAQTTLAVSGARAGGGRADPRIRAAIAFSPQPALALPDAQAFGTITMPFLSLTGTEDALPWLTQVTPKDRERPFRAMAPGSKYLIVLAGATHANFGGQNRTPMGGPALTPHIRDVTIQVTILFWRAMLKGDAVAKRELDGFAATLPPEDRFERR